jgi:hypothetical protein
MALSPRVNDVLEVPDGTGGAKLRLAGVVADPVVLDARAKVMNSAPTGTEYGLVVRNIGAAGGGGPATIADCADVVEGCLADAAITTDAPGTVNGKLRGLVKWAFERMPASLGQKLMALSFPVVIASDQTAISVSSAAQPGVDIGDVTINNAGGAAAVNIQDGGNSITIDTPQLPATLGQKTMANSLPVVIASDQSTLPVDVTDRSARLLGHTTVDSMPSASALVSDTLPTYTPGDTKPISMTTSGQLRVITVEESFNFAGWGTPEKFQDPMAMHAYTAW